MMGPWERERGVCDDCSSRHDLKYDDFARECLGDRYRTEANVSRLARALQTVTLNELKTITRKRRKKVL